MLRRLFILDNLLENLWFLTRAKMSFPFLIACRVWKNTTFPHVRKITISVVDTGHAHEFNQ